MILIPSVSIGNVPQLALDLIIYNYNFELVASLDDEFLCPFVGPADYLPSIPQPGGITTAAQLFRNGSNYIVQLRSPALSGCKQKFVKTLMNELKHLEEFNVNEIVIIGSANAALSEHREQTDYVQRINGSNVPPLPESGFVKELLNEAPNSDAIITWVHEGDNISDSQRLVSVLIKRLGFREVDLQYPVSWARVYGRDAPLGVENGLYT